MVSLSYPRWHVDAVCLVVTRTVVYALLLCTVLADWRITGKSTHIDTLHLCKQHELP
jgi:hypothetical protein